MPALWLSQNSLRNGGSVEACCVTANCIGVSFCFSSAAAGFWYLSIAALVNGGGTTVGFVTEVWDCARAQPARTAAASAAEAAREAIGFTRFMQENSTGAPGTKMGFTGEVCAWAGSRDWMKRGKN